MCDESARFPTRPEPEGSQGQDCTDPPPCEAPQLAICAGFLAAHAFCSCSSSTSLGYWCPARPYAAPSPAGLSRATPLDATPPGSRSLRLADPATCPSAPAPKARCDRILLRLAVLARIVGGTAAPFGPGPRGNLIIARCARAVRRQVDAFALADHDRFGDDPARGWRCDVVRAAPDAVDAAVASARVAAGTMACSKPLDRFGAIWSSLPRVVGIMTLDYALLWSARISGRETDRGGRPRRYGGFPRRLGSTEPICARATKSSGGRGGCLPYGRRYEYGTGRQGG